MNQTKPSNPSEITRILLFRSLRWVVGITLLCGAAVSVTFGAQALKAWIAGVMIVVLPDAWVAHQLTTGRHYLPVVLGLSKYVLSGVGFAVLFAFMPETPVIWVLAGAVTAILGIPIAFTVLQKGTTKKQG